MQVAHDFKIISACPTVFREDQAISYGETADVLDFLDRIGISAVALFLFGGEYYRLSLQEKKEMMDLLMRSTNFRGEFLIGVNDISLNAVLDLARYAYRSDASAIIISPPNYVPFYSPRRSFVEHFLAKIIENSGISAIFQDTDLPDSLLPRIEFWKKYAESEKISGFKIEGKKAVERMKDIRAYYPDKKIYGGYLGLNLTEEIAAGSNGSIIGSSIPDLVSRDLLRRAEDKSGILRKFLNFEVSHLSIFVEIEKYILKKRGVLENFRCRDPCPHLSKLQMAKIDHLYSEMIP
ncbi:dihydrodipicolinate synthase family protein [Thermoplasma sp.]|uniref:dihydrodipicolinate synthase family protein n=1 Tax=Thermoplasma sp. TaxID=1973142 RepID=UPI0025DE8C1F|nr:dihydrodipicolinate synthase family protein [Thermoplasma sp.]